MDVTSITGLVTALGGILSYLQVAKDRPLQDSLRNAPIPPEEPPKPNAGLASELPKTPAVSSLPPTEQIKEIKSASVVWGQRVEQTGQEWSDYYRAESDRLRENYNSFLVRRLGR